MRTIGLMVFAGVLGLSMPGFSLAQTTSDSLLDDPIFDKRVISSKANGLTLRAAMARIVTNSATKDVMSAAVREFDVQDTTCLPPPNPMPARSSKEWKTIQVVGDGELFYEISRRVWGDAMRWPEIWRLNAQWDVLERIPGGTFIKVPKK
jgi:hypothetical protein